MRCTAYASSLVLLAAVPALCETPEQRGIRYLSTEVPRWAAENRCYSCHNNGDGARVLYAAKQFGYKVVPAALADTTKWLQNPTDWEKGRAGTPAGDASISDKKLARIQFAAALACAVAAGSVTDEQPLIKAAEPLVQDQEPDGSWRIDGEDNVGSPVTYGRALATAMSLHALEVAGGDRFAAAIGKARGWLSRSQPRSVIDAAAIFMVVPERRDALLTYIAKAQTNGGGWGPHQHSPAEPFDTAIALLALQQWNKPDRTEKLIGRGRAYLISVQQPSGGWPETTRPAGAQSYAQHISTSAWATLALLATDPERQ
jgi:hypothetical protein